MLIQNIGHAPSGIDLEKAKHSSHFQNGAFQNIEPTEMMLKSASYLELLIDYIRPPKTIRPSRPLPNVHADLSAVGDSGPAVVWFGHSSYMIRHHGRTVLVDPVLVGGASPVSFAVKPFAGTNPYSPEDLPTIDLLLLTHDHYDHLSYPTLMALKEKVKHIVAPLGVSSHLKNWGFNEAMITELDWNESAEPLEKIHLTALPSRHFSGRLFKRNQTVWNSYVLEFNGLKIFIGGDSGYDGQFKKTGEAFGPFDIAFIECGQYGKNWPYIHMFPEQTAQAAEDLKTNVLLPVHWSKFILSTHPWNESMKRLKKASTDRNFKVVTPMIGEPYTIGSSQETPDWWDFE